LESILKDIERHGLPKAHSRSTIKRAREKQIEEYSTSYGPVLQALEVLELGSWALSREAFWFCLCAVKSSTVQKIGGMSLLMPHLLELFRMPFDTSSGIYLRHEDWRVMFFGQVALHIGDEVACKSVLGVKGAAGTNGVDFKSALQDHDDRLIPSTCLEFSRFRQHTTESVRDAHQLLRERHE
ncbi:unnamed protein product, partial [Durusdinium trenchii]